MKSLKKNYLYSIIYQVLILFVPFITVPYVSRVLGADQVGVYSFTYSIVYYCMLFAMLGINNYGNREIAKSRDDLHKTSRTFFSIYAIQLVSSLFMSLVYLLYVLFFSGSHQAVALIQGICMLSVLFDINWFFFGHEEFKLTIIRNALIKISTLIAILTFVKTSSDLPIYTFISALGVLFSQLALLPFLKKRLVFVRPTLKDIKKHIKPCLVLFIPVISIGIYTIMDKTMLGILSNMSEVGYYSQAEKIVSLPSTLITALSTVMMPRMSHLVAKSDHQKINEYLDKAIRFMSFVSIPMAMGLIVIANSFIPIFLGPGFEKSSIIMATLSIVIVFKAIGSVFRSQYMTPHNMDKEYAITAIIGAVVNLVANLIFIPQLQSLGACIGTILAELSVVIYMGYALKDALPLKDYAHTILSYLWKGIIMLIVIFPINFMPNLNNYTRIITEVLSGILVYSLLNYRVINNIIRRKTIWMSK